MANLKIFVLLFSLFLLFGCTQQGNSPPGNGGGTTTPPQGSTASVEIRDFKFVPADLVVAKGTTVKWTNFDSAPHTATSAGNFDSGTLQKGQFYSFTFNNAGTFDYICTLHPYMKAKITVS